MINLLTTITTAEHPRRLHHHLLLVLNLAPVEILPAAALLPAAETLLLVVARLPQAVATLTMVARLLPSAMTPRHPALRLVREVLAATLTAASHTAVNLMVVSPMVVSLMVATLTAVSHLVDLPLRLLLPHQEAPLHRAAATLTMVARLPPSAMTALAHLHRPNLRPAQEALVATLTAVIRTAASLTVVSLMVVSLTGDLHRRHHRLLPVLSPVQAATLTAVARHLMMTG